MGQQLSQFNEKFIPITKNDSTELTSDAIINGSGRDDILTLLNVLNSTSISERFHTKQIQNYLLQLTNSAEHKTINLEIYQILFENVFKNDLANHFQNMISEVKDMLDKQQKLQSALKKPLPGHRGEDRTQQLTSLAIKSVTSVLLILIKSAEKHDPTIIQQILTLADQLCEELPMKCLSSSINSTSLTKSLEPLTTYITDLSLREDLNIKKQITKILLCFSIAKESFKDILPIISKLLFEMNEVYDARNLLVQLNNGLDDTIKELETTNTSDEQSDKLLRSIPLEYLKSIGVFPTTKLMELNEEKFTGHFFASAILAHIDFYHAIHSNEQFNNSSINSRLFFEFDHNTFQQLFYLIQQLTIIFEKQSNPTIDYMLTICLRLFTTHLKFLCTLKSTIDQDILTTNTVIKHALTSSPSSQDNIDLEILASETDLAHWFKFLFKLACLDNQNSRNIVICKEASKGLLFLFEKNTTFIDKLSFIHRFIIENKHTILIEHLWLELSKTTTLLSWIELILQDGNQSEDGTALTILYSFIDMYFNSSERAKEILSKFNKLLLFRLGPVFEKKTDYQSPPPVASSAIVKYLLRILNSCITSDQIVPDMFNDILIGLYLMTEQETGIAFLSVQPIFIVLIPLLADYIIQNKTNNDYVKIHLHFLSWLLGRMSFFLIVSLPKDVLEIKYSNNLNSLLFMNGCEPVVTEKNSYLINLFNSNLVIYSHFKLDQQSSLDNEFLMSIYNNQGQGAELISKMKFHMKNKQRFLQKSIEHFVHDACAALFAVYIKHYRRIQLAKLELLRPNHDKPHDKLLSIFEYANRVQTIFMKTKGQGGNCEELLKQIKNNAFFLLLSVKENNVIPIIDEHSLTTESSTPSAINLEQNPMPQFKRQQSRWTKAKNIIRLLKNSMRACIRLKKLMMAKKRIVEQEHDPERILSHLIDDYIYEDKKHEPDEFLQCLCRQYERAMTRLVIYRFIETFISKVLNINDHNRALSILAIYLPHLRHIDLVEWTYTENIQASNIVLKEAIANSYYSCIHRILSHQLQLTTDESMILISPIFRLLNLSYRSIDLYYLDRYQLIQTLCKTYINFIDKTNSLLILKSKLFGYTWFRLFVYKLCDNIQEEKIHGTVNPLFYQQRDFIFQSIIFRQLKELKQLKQVLSIAAEEQPVDSKEENTNSLRNTSFRWFIKQATTVMNDQTMTISDIELSMNQFLVLLLRCVHLYEHIRLFCATIEYIEELLDIYHHSHHQSTQLLTMKILRDIICFLPEKINGQTTIMMKDLFNEIFISIVNNDNNKKISVEIITEWIYIYRTIMSIKSTWQSIAIEKIFNSITSIPTNQELLEKSNKNELNYFIAAMRILGGYIQPYGLGSIVRIYKDDEDIDEFELGLITETDTVAFDQDSANSKTYLVEYNQPDNSHWFSVNKLYMNIEVLPPNLFTISNKNDSIVTFHAFLDMLGYLLQLNTSTSTSFTLIQLQRYAIMVFYRLLNDKSLVEIFMQKPYASIMAQLALGNKHLLPNDLRLFNREHLEQYYLSLNRRDHSKTIVENETFQNVLSTSAIEDSLYINWNDIVINRDQSIIDTLSTRTSKYGGWKVNASKAEIEFYKQGRIGSDDISIVSIPRDIVEAPVFEECGDKHRFYGRINGDSSYIKGSFPTFTFENLELNEGKWYYCVKLTTSDIIQIGWATAGFKPETTEGRGVGDDIYSWCYDGSRHCLFHDGTYQFPSEDIRWKENDVCGCGIEIDGENTRINYWLNGKFLGTAFSHESHPSSSTLKCNMIPYGCNTTYFPCVSIDINIFNKNHCELIVSPEDMNQCPLPSGYKPLLTPKLVQIENSIVAYPYNAYLVGDNVEDYFKSESLLRDFINEEHLKTTFTLNDQWLIISENSGGLSLPLNTLESSITISFELKLTSITSDDEEIMKNKQNLLLLKLDEKEIISIAIPSNENDEINEIHIAIIFYQKEQQTKVYINNKCRIFQSGLDLKTTTISTLFLLPNGNVQIRNVGLWKYALSEDHIRRLFTYGLFYVAIDYHEQKEYHQQANTFLFSKDQTIFSNKLLLPFKESFVQNRWLDKKKQNDIDGKKYFTYDESSIQLFGNNTYLVLDTSNQHLSRFTLILDISIPKFPIDNEQLTLVTFTPELGISLTHTGHLCLFNGDTTKTSETMMILNEYIRLLICIEEKMIKIYQNGTLILDVNVDYESIQSTVTHIDLFRELDLNKNTTSEETLRIQCKSITFRNQPITTAEIDEYMKSPDCTLDTYIAPSLQMLTSSLIAIGYKESWIQSMMKHYHTRNLQQLDALIREHKEELMEKEKENQRTRILDILSKLGPSIDREKLNILIMNDDLAVISELILNCWNDLQIATVDNDNKEGLTWFYQTVGRLGIKGSVNKWMQDKSKTYNDNNSVYQLFDLTKSEQNDKIGSQSKRKKKSLHYSHETLTQKQYLSSRLACEHGLITIYTREAILNMLEIWSNDQSSLFPWEKFGDYTFILKLIQLLDYHSSYSSTRVNPPSDRMSSIIKFILKHEIKQLSKQTNINNQLEKHAPFLYELQKDFIVQTIRFLENPSLLMKNLANESVTINEQMLLQESNIDFLLKIINLFSEIITDQSQLNQNEIETSISIFFSELLINLLFDLFLLIPTHQAKICILRLFTSLIQTSNNIPLNKEILQFLLRLFMELSTQVASTSDQTIKRLYISVMDIVYLLSLKQPSDSTLNDCLEVVRNLFTVIDIINILNDTTKQTPWPESFLANSSYTSEELDRMKDHFNAITDLQVLSLMNKKLSSDDSFDEFINSLPTELESTAEIYKEYPSLSNIPGNYVRMRAKFFYQLNALIEEVLPTVDVSLPFGYSILMDKFRKAKIYLLHKTKYKLLGESLEQTTITNDYLTPSVKFDTLKASQPGENGENTMFNQAFEQLFKNASSIFRREEERLWHAVYVGMNSIDAGGPYRDSITCMCSDICSTRLSLFILCPNGRTKTGANQDRWIPNAFSPKESIPNVIRNQYRFVGQLMGMAIRQKYYLDFKFPTLLWKQLIQEPITLEDIKTIDMQSFKIIKEMEMQIEQSQLIDADIEIDFVFSSIMSELRFDVISSAGQTYELVPGGKDIPITATNLKDYCQQYRDYRLNEFSRQINFIRQGLYSTVPSYYLGLYTAEELERAVCGKGQIDIDLLKRNTYYAGDLQENSPHIQRFWTVLNDMFNEEQKKSFLIFVWGRSTLPTRDEDFTSKFYINSYYTSNDETDRVLPGSHTCSFGLDLPAYSTTEIMYERLNYAVTYCSSIDAD